LFHRESTYEEYEENNYIDAHHLNRRKSCVCMRCGGADSEAVKKMDK
jgi:hypothetical protein